MVQCRESFVKLAYFAWLTDWQDRYPRKKITETIRNEAMVAAEKLIRKEDSFRLETIAGN